MPHALGNTEVENPTKSITFVVFLNFSDCIFPLGHGWRGPRVVHSGEMGPGQWAAFFVTNSLHAPPWAWCWEFPLPDELILRMFGGMLHL